MSIKTILMSVLRLACYGMLAVMLVLAAAMAVLLASGTCVAAGPAFSCAGENAQTLADLALSLLLLSVFTGLPLLLALGGVAFAVIDGIALFQRKQ